MAHVALNSTQGLKQEKVYAQIQSCACPKGHEDTSLRLSPGSNTTSCSATSPQGFLSMYFYISLLTPVMKETKSSQKGPSLQCTALCVAGKRDSLLVQPPTETNPPPTSFMAGAVCRVLCSCPPPRSRAGEKPKLLFPLGNRPAAGALAGQAGEELLMAGGIYNLCLVPARLDACSCFPPYNEIKQRWDISSLLADEIPASAALLRPAWGCSLFLLRDSWGVAAAVLKWGISSFLPLHYQSSWVRGTGGLELWYLCPLASSPVLFLRDLSEDP